MLDTTLKELTGIIVHYNSDANDQLCCEICEKKHDFLEIEGIFRSFIPPTLGDSASLAVFQFEFKGSSTCHHRSESLFVMVKRKNETNDKFRERQQMRMDLITKANAENEPVKVKYVGPCVDGGLYKAHYGEGVSEIDEDGFSASIIRDINILKDKIKSIDDKIRETNESIKSEKKNQSGNQKNAQALAIYLEERMKLVRQLEELKKLKLKSIGHQGSPDNVKKRE